MDAQVRKEMVMGAPCIRSRQDDEHIRRVMAERRRRCIGEGFLVARTPMVTKHMEAKDGE
jgi:hypothetical protein